MDVPSRPNIVCVTPVKNEAWILERFLRCASMWADEIVLADQQSTDATREIAGRFPKVRLIENPQTEYSEVSRQRLLLEAARTVPKPRLIMALDADEFLSSNYLKSLEWGTLLASPPGTVACFQWVNVSPDLQTGWNPEIDLPMGFMDDESPHKGGDLHNWRVPMSTSAPRLLLREIKVLHYQYTDWQRMKSKHRWYQCWELLKDPGLSTVDLFRKYHHMYSVPEKQRLMLQEPWLAGYRAVGIDMTSVRQQVPYYWDGEVARWLVEQGPERFAKLDIWGVDWDTLYRQIFHKPPPRLLADPRTAEQKEVIGWLRSTQARAAAPEVIEREKALKAAGW